MSGKKLINPLTTEDICLRRGLFRLRFQLSRSVKL
nr:MAG TPA: hypothetical protein [Caudoviricetes sp.]